MLKAVGYQTGLGGKWHLGINEHSRDDGSHLPHNHGFEYVGWNMPFSHHWACDDGKVRSEICRLWIMRCSSSFVFSAHKWQRNER